MASPDAGRTRVSASTSLAALHSLLCLGPHLIKASPRLASAVGNGSGNKLKQESIGDGGGVEGTGGEGGECQVAGREEMVLA